MAVADIKLRWGVSESNCEEAPVLIVGQARHLGALAYQDIRCKVQPFVTEETWKRGLSCLKSHTGDRVELWPQGAVLASLPVRVSRHNTPSRAHSLAAIVHDNSKLNVQSIVLVCRKRDLYASVLAIARSFPLYNARTTKNLFTTTPVSSRPFISIEIILAKEIQEGEDEEILDPYLTDGTLSNEDLEIISAAVKGVRLAAKIVDTPANEMNVDQIIAESIAIAKELNIAEPTVIRGEELAERGFGGIYGVGKGAVQPPAIVCLQWTPAGATENVAWVGKGITFDTGGLSLKAPTMMVGMKRDCGGAAGILGAFYTAVKAKPAFNLYAVLCVAENAAGPKSTRPDDVHRLYSGRTVEINNTDAEGRLVLGDGVVYAARDLKANVIVDVATLTGAQGIATGNYHAAILSNSARLEALGVRSGRISGDLTYPVVFTPELHMDEFSCTVADMKNSVASRSNAQVSCSGLFMLAHLGFDFPGEWLHVDMASPAYCGERGTGYGVALLSVLCGEGTQNKLLRALAPKS